MNSYMAHAYEAEREREWANSQDHPEWDVPDAVRRTSASRFRRFLVILLIAGSSMFAVLGPDTGLAHTLPPCFGWSTTHQMSFRQPITIRYRRIPMHTIHRLYCRTRQGDPVNQHLAVVSRHNG